MIRKTSTLATLLTVATLAAGCSDVQPHGIAVRKSYGGEVTFTDGPKWEYLGPGTVTQSWSGRRWIDLPLQRGSEQTELYQTADGLLLLDMNIAYFLGTEDAQRRQWFVNTNNAEDQFPKAVEGVVRATTKTYTNEEILNEMVAIAHRKLPYPMQVQVDLMASAINAEYGIDAKAYAVWPGNNALQQTSMNADLQRQRRVMLNAAQNEAQTYKEQAAAIKAEVDGEYSTFIRNLTPAQLEYLQTLDMIAAMRHTTEDPNQTVDIIVNTKR